MLKEKETRGESEIERRMTGEKDDRREKIYLSLAVPLNTDHIE